MSGNTIQGLLRRRDFGNEKVRRQKYDEAIQDFQQVVENLVVDNDQKASLKMMCYNQIALCKIELGDLDGAEVATRESINIFNIMRPDEMKKKQHRKNDILFPLYHTALCRIGQIEEKLHNLKKAITIYQGALVIYPKGEAKQLISDCLVQFGIPPVDLEDPNLMPYSKIYNCIFDINALIGCYQECIDKINNQMPNEEEIQKLDDGGIVQMILGVVDFLLDSDDANAEIVIDISLTVAALFIKRGATKAWANAYIIKKVIEHFKGNQKLLSTCLTILGTCPVKKYQIFAEESTVRVLVDALKLELSQDQVNEIFRFLYYTLDKNSKLIEYIAETDVLDFAIKTHSVDSFLLVSRLILSEKVANMSKTNGVIDWAFSTIAENINISAYIQISLVIIGRIIQVANKTDEKTDNEGGNGFDLKEFSARCFKELLPVIKQNQKDPSILTDTFTILSYVLPNAKEMIHETKLLPISSVLLSANIDNIEFVTKQLSFIYQCAKLDLVEEISSVKPLLPTIMKALDKYPNKQPIVEYSIALAVLLNHPNKETLLQSGLMQFPSSPILKVYVDILKFALVKEKVNQK
ncbi:hypothetical protein TRFO_34773 [Tritrichomonas foetus]|uniref:TPR Domain containing protein n=1 Tax=Tritrichomonas foetus TaxID=1144522 RepID=A0A1J4JI89_9EUKA|nr:hypothetical protein TRFO_34773 [Tritrichomonas foetus]|eukprot:OHS98904.1 hypothetical protein TRFO_34773 [Tritrichomonas foetus]